MLSNTNTHGIEEKEQRRFYYFNSIFIHNIIQMRGILPFIGLQFLAPKKSLGMKG
jgi:hypothetical protein